tara:strand:- start:548 stop:1309 length:762 start_codon:yes stop_codon:yes gene_type:complete
MSQSQKHGFIFENSVRNKIFNLEEEKNNTDKYDIPKEKNILDENENVSIKTTGSNCICTSDIQRFNNYDFESNNTLILLKYSQNGGNKTIQNIYEINYSKELHTHLFGDLSEQEILNYVSNVKKIPKTVKGDEAKQIFDYLVEQKKIYQKHPTLKLKINPKVDSAQSRVQCSINIKDIPEQFITYNSIRDTSEPNFIRGKQIILSIDSPPRERGGITVKQLKNICKENNIKGYSKLKKKDLIDLLTNKNISYN